ncbi:MAG: DNA recombination protein RmuC [bacterium]|nr:DNA recombination protein RmuC [bacterium]
MNYIIITLLLITIILLLIILIKGKKSNLNEGNITEKLSQLDNHTIKELAELQLKLLANTNENFNNLNSLVETKLRHIESHTIKELSEFKTNLITNTNKNFNSLNDKIENKLTQINEKVNERLDVNFEKTNKTFTSVLERLSKIDEAQKKIDALSLDIVSLQSILTDKKSRGIFGEINLKHILSSIFGEKNDNVYCLQYTFPNKTIADAVIFAPEPLGTVAIDSKFPLENYQIMVDKNRNQVERNNAEKQFKIDVKKHIDAISTKYIIRDITSDQAIMFLPAEALFAEINAYHPDIVEYAHKKKVWLTSPTTLISTFTVIQVLLKNIQRDKYTSIIHQELNKLGIEFSRYKERWEKLSRSIETVNKDVENINITTDKITKRFDSINQVEIKTDDLLE